MAEIWSTNRYILLILSFTFPDGVSQKIFNYMKEAEYEDSRKEHMMDCVLYRVEAKIGKIIKDLFPTVYYHGRDRVQRERFVYHDETLRHVDHNINNINLIREFYKSLPRPSILRRREERYPLINCMNEYDIPIKDSWMATWCVAFRILDRVLERQPSTWDEIRRFYPELWRRTCSQGNTVEYQNYNGILHYPVIKLNEYIRKDDLSAEMKRNRKWEKKIVNGIIHQHLLGSVSQMKMEQSFKKKFKKNDSYLFKKRHCKNHCKRPKYRKYGISK